MQVLRTVPDHLIWVAAEGTPPINITIFKNSLRLSESRTGIIMRNFTVAENYKFVASNKAGNDSKQLSITFVGKKYYALT